MKLLILALALLAVAAHVWLSRQLYNGPNETILTAAVQPGISHDFEGVSIHYDYLDGILEGTVPSETARKFAEARVLALSPAGRIMNRLQVPQMAKIPARLIAKLANGRVILQGFVPNKEVKARIIQAAAERGVGPVVDQLIVNPNATDPSWLARTPQFLGDFFKEASSGELEVDSTTVRIKREVENEAAKQTWATRAGILLPEGRLLDELHVREIGEFSFELMRFGINLELTGWIPDPALKEKILAEARRQFPRLTVSDRLEVAPSVKMPDWGNALPDFVGSLDPNFTGDLNFDLKGLNLGGWSGTSRAKLEELARGTIGTKFPSFNPPVIPTLPSNVLAVLADNALVLTGKVPSEDLKKSLEETAAAVLPGVKITNKLSVDSMVKPPSWGAGVARLLGDFLKGNPEAAEFEIDPEKLRLKQVLPNEPSRESLAAEARALLPEGRFVDELSVAPPALKSEPPAALGQ